MECATDFKPGTRYIPLLINMRIILHLSIDIWDNLSETATGTYSHLQHIHHTTSSRPLHSFTNFHSPHSCTIQEIYIPPIRLCASVTEYQLSEMPPLS